VTDPKDRLAVMLVLAGAFVLTTMFLLGVAVLYMGWGL
jgi:hypothetical protein